MVPAMRIALVEPYYGGSHQAWADGYSASSAHTVTEITHPARFWKWRMHGAFLTLADQLADDIDANGLPDVILASSMMNVAAFAGAVRTVAPGVPIAVYFHESQFTYPLSPADKADATYPMKNWSSAATADLVIFNSKYHRSVFRDEARKFLNVFPEFKHVEKVDDVIDASIVLPVGIGGEGLDPSKTKPKGPPLIVWNQRWEHDKGPDELKAIVEGLIESGVEFNMAMCGEVFVSVPPTYGEVTDLLGDRLSHSGWAERDDYIDLLNSASVVLSTAHQEFFGIGITEAVAAGAHPVFPDRLVYPERIADFRANPNRSLYESPQHAVNLIAQALGSDPDQAIAASAGSFDWVHIAPRYDEALANLV
jgi:glycosyltransferase involved in cell wall biosynthesis